MTSTEDTKSTVSHNIINQNVDSNNLQTRLILNDKSYSDYNNRVIDEDLKSKETDNLNLNKENQEEMDIKKSIWIRFFGPIKEGSLRGGVLAMASITFGGGCLAFSSSFRDMGLINGLIIFFIIAFISLYTLVLLTISGVKSGIYDYNLLIEKFMGKKMVIFSDVNNLILCLGVIVGYQKFIYEFAIDIIEYFFDDLKKQTENVELYVILICFLFIQIPLTSLKKISVLQYASITGSLALIYSIICVCIKMPKNFQENQNENNKIVLFKSLSLKYLVSISVFLFGFSSHNGIFQVYVEVKKPSAERYSKLLKRSFFLEVVLYLLISLGGYLSFLAKTDDNILKNYESKDISILIAKIALFICLHCSMAINYNIMRQSYKSFFKKEEELNFTWYKDLFFSVLTLLISNIIVYNLNSARQILGIVGGISTCIICFWNPIMIYLKVFNFNKFSFKKIFAIFVLVFVLILGTSSTVYSIYDFIQTIINNKDNYHI